jgi:hypothetical protein
MPMPSQGFAVAAGGVVDGGGIVGLPPPEPPQAAAIVITAAAITRVRNCRITRRLTASVAARGGKVNRELGWPASAAGW